MNRLCIGNAGSAQHQRQNHAIQHSVHRNALRSSSDTSNLKHRGLQCRAVMRANSTCQRAVNIKKYK
jgi:hypothetical protein